MGRLMLELRKNNYIKFHTLDSIRARDLDQGEEEEEDEAGKSGLNLISK